MTAGIILLQLLLRRKWRQNE